MLGTRIERSHWAFPEAGEIEGRYCRLVPLNLNHVAALWPLVEATPESFTYLLYGPFDVSEELSTLIADLSSRQDQPFWAVLDATGTPQGWLSICDVSQNDGAFEIGSIWFAPALQGTRAAREAIFLLMYLGMEKFDYERLVWRCQAQNAKSFQAALNLGFTREGMWRNAAVIDGWQRDVAWFSILKADWPECKGAFEAWLDPENFDAAGKQIKRLQEFRA